MTSTLSPELPADAGSPSPPSHPRRRRVVTHPRRTLLVLAVLVVVAVLVPLLVVAAARAIANSKAGTIIRAEAGPAVSVVGASRLPDTPGALIVVTDSSGAPVNLVVAALAPSGRGGTLVVVPTSTLVSADDGRPSRLGDALAAGGLDAQTAAVEHLLGISLSGAVQVDTAGLASLLAPYAPITVNLAEPVKVSGAAGSSVVVPAGNRGLSGAEAAAVLASRRPNEAELDRLPQQVALWEALARKATASAAGSAPPATSVPVRSDATTLLDAVLSGPVSVASVPAEAVLDPVRNPEGLDLLAPDAAAMRLLMARVLPGAVSPASTGMRFRIVNPTGDPELTYKAVARLAYVGANIVMASETNDQAPASTVIEFQGDDGGKQASFYAPVLGGATLTPATQAIDGIDATIVLGTSFRAFIDQEETKAAAAAGTTSASTTDPGSTVPSGPTTSAGSRP